MRRTQRVAWWILAGALAAAACGDDAEPERVNLARPVRSALAKKPFERLSSYNLFSWDPADGFRFNTRVVPYDLNTPLFSDYALKQRALYVPEGEAARYEPEQAFELPVGAVLIKSFLFPEDLREPTRNLRLIETRLLVQREDGIEALPYVWDAAQRDAHYAPAGEVQTVSFIDADGERRVANYLIPQRNQCEECHARKQGAFSPPVLAVIGLKARHLNRAYDYGEKIGSRNQLEHLTELGLLDELPALETIPAAFDFRLIERDGVEDLAGEELDTAARSYLDINCAHCHEPNAVQGDTSRLFLNHGNTDPFHLGVCKRPGSAGTGNGGLTFDIVPGDPDSSILYFRTHTDQVGAMMPLLGRSLTHERGAELLRAWIGAMPADDCQTDR